jgi:glutamine amidotransferase
MECNVPTDIVFSFSGLALRGGRKGPHGDGWGLALYDGKAVRTFLETTAAANSSLARFVKENPIKTLLAVAHVRKKTRGSSTLANTHPFVRELWGRAFTFAHNGTVRRVRRLPLGRFQPIGDTDSEYAFCVLLGKLSRAFNEYPRTARDLARFYEIVARAGRLIGESGTFNFLLGDGTHLFARCATKLHYIVRKAPFRVATLADDDVQIDFSDVTTPRDRVVVVATMPLTRDEVWTQGKPGTLWVFDRGSLRATLAA